MKSKIENYNIVCFSTRYTRNKYSHFSLNLKYYAYNGMLQIIALFNEVGLDMIEIFMLKSVKTLNNSKTVVF